MMGGFEVIILILRIDFLFLYYKFFHISYLTPH